MRQVFIKDLKLFLTDKRAVILTFFLPIILCTLFAIAFGGLGRSDSADPIDLLVADSDQTSASEKFVNLLESEKGFVIYRMEIEKATQEIREGNYPAVLALHAGFQDSLSLGHSLPLELIYDKAREIEVGFAQPLLIQALMSVKGPGAIGKELENYLKSSFPTMDQAFIDKLKSDVQDSGSFSDGSGANADIQMTSIVGEEENSPNLGVIQAVAGTAILMLLFSVARLGAGILDEKETGTLNRLLSSPLSSNAILLGKMAVTWLVAVLQLWVMFFFAWIAFGLDLWINVPSLILMIFATAFAVSSFGIFLAAISRTHSQAQSLSTLLILIMSAIGGSMIPLFIMPAIMRKIAVVTLNYWGMEGFFDIFWRQLPLINTLPKILILIAMGAVMTFISVHLFRKNVFKLV
jgi:ABC-2 type transport system permease protein